MSNIYRRGAVYWWRRSVRLDRAVPRSIMLRLSLKTSDKSEAKRRAAALELELEMVAITIPKALGRTSTAQLQAVYKQALAYKRDQIAMIQSRPPFNDDRHRLANRANAKLFTLLAHSGSDSDRSKQWEALLTDPALDADESELLARLAEHHDLAPRNNDDWARLRARLKSPQYSSTGTTSFHAPLGRPAIAPRYITNLMENVQIEDTDENRKTVLAVVAAAYRTACVEANEALGDKNAEFKGGELPKSLLALIGQSTVFRPQDTTDGLTHISATSTLPQEVAPAISEPPSPTESAGLIDLQMSELCALAVQENKRTGDWKDSAQRNANAISAIFTAENGDLRMSEIERRHLLALDMKRPGFSGGSDL